MILESIVTSVASDGVVNIAPMGPRVEQGEPPRFTLRPFAGSTTYRNLTASRRAVIHVTDDALLLARAAVGPVDASGLVEPVGSGSWWRLKDCHRWFAVEVEDICAEGPRAEMPCRVVDSAVVRPFFGFNRAKHAVIEAAILATRTHLIDAETIEAELRRLRPLIDKTAGPDEHEAFELLCRSIRQCPTS